MDEHASTLDCLRAVRLLRASHVRQNLFSSLHLAVSHLHVCPRRYREGRAVIVILCLCVAGCLGAITAALVFYHKLVSDDAFQNQGRRLIGLVVSLAVGVPTVALLSMNDTRAPDGAYVNGIVGQFLALWSLLPYGVGFFYARLAIRVVNRRQKSKSPVPRELE
jgi:hypothetical protein